MKSKRKQLVIIGSGAREHALAEVMELSPSAPVISCLGSAINPGIVGICSNTGGTYRTGAITNPEESLSIAEACGADLMVIGPEAPLAAGTADLLRAKGFAVLGPDRALARIETSKSWARELLESCVPEACPKYFVVHSIGEAEKALVKLGTDFVIKADGLTGGKGVKVSGDHLASHDEAIDYCRELLPDEGYYCVIEDKLIGEEFSLMTLTDGKVCIHMPAVQDHKRAYPGDTGPNTGGMGSYTGAGGILPFLEKDDIMKARVLNEAVVRALGKVSGKPYRGVLYGGFMAVADGVKIVEYNARFGDPEALNLMTLFTGDAAELFYQAGTGTLPEDIDYAELFSEKASVCKYAVPTGYPTSPVKGTPIDISGVTEKVKLYLGSVDSSGGNLVLGGSRTAAVAALGSTISEAEAATEEAVSSIGGELFHRPDIGTDELVEKRITHMQEVRGRDSW